MRSPEATAAFFAEYERLVLHGAGVEVSRELAWRVWQEVRKIRYDLALFDDVLPSLRRLKDLGLRLGIISNINRTGPDLLQSLGLEGVVDSAITSREVGAEKPHAPIFQAALHRLGAEAAEAVHVGDQYASDIVGALGVGMGAVLIDRYGTAESCGGGRESWLADGGGGVAGGMSGPCRPPPFGALLPCRTPPPAHPSTPQGERIPTPRSW